MSKIYRLDVEFSAPGIRDHAIVEGGKIEDVTPHFADRSGLTFERYGNDEDGFVEVRLDWVVRRTMEVQEDYDGSPTGGVKAVTMLGPAALVRGEEDVR